MKVAYTIALLPLAAGFTPTRTSRRTPTSSRPIPVSNNTLPIRRHLLPVAYELRKRDAAGTVISPNMNLIMSTEIIFDGVPVNLLIDTGSSELFFARNGYECLLENDAPCDYKPTTFDPDNTAAQPISPPTFFNTGYADGDYVIGSAYKGTVDFAGVTIPNQVYSVVDKARWHGDGVTSGLLGLGSLYGNQIYYGSSAADVSDDNRLIYYNPATNAWKQGLIGPFHTLAIERIAHTSENADPTYAGTLTLGGRPANLAITNVQVTFDNPTWQPTAAGARVNEVSLDYIKQPVSFVFQGSDAINTVATSAHIDSGASAMFLPSQVYNAWIKLLPDRLLCDGSNMPDLTVVIAGVEFPIDRRDLMHYDPASDGCYVAVASQGDGSGTIGAPFLPGHVITYDRSSQRTTVVQRAPY